MRKFRSFLPSLLLLLAGMPCSAADGPSDRIVVMISVDGLAHYYLDDPKAEMTTIRRLATEGARAAMMKASVPTVTYCSNHTTLVTGVEPARHGVVGNNYFDRATGKIVTLLTDPVYDKDQIVKAPTIYDLAKAAGLRTAAVIWPASRNAKTLDWTVPDVATDRRCIRNMPRPSYWPNARRRVFHLKSTASGIAPENMTSATASTHASST